MGQDKKQPESKPFEKSQLNECLIFPREQGDSLFLIRPSEDGGTEVLCNLDKYAIVPIEHYMDLRDKAGLP